MGDIEYKPSICFAFNSVPNFMLCQCQCEFSSHTYFTLVQQLLVVLLPGGDFKTSDTSFHVILNNNPTASTVRVFLNQSASRIPMNRLSTLWKIYQLFSKWVLIAQTTIVEKKFWQKRGTYRGCRTQIRPLWLGHASPRVRMVRTVVIVTLEAIKLQLILRTSTQHHQH